ncbi:MAG: FAD binding domain-containing protein, partial [Novosphingobium sp.]
MALANLQDYQQPSDLKAAIAFKQQWGDRALIVAGGTFVHGLAARGLLNDIEAVLDISRVGLDRIELRRDGISIGATATYGALAAHRVVRDEGRFGALADALSYPPPQILNVATVGGCLASSCPLFDLPVAAAALGGVIVATSTAGETRHDISGFFTGLFESSLSENEVVTSIELSVDQNVVSGFSKLETNANDLALVNAAVSLTFKKGLFDRRAKCVEARAWVGGGVGETICHLPTVEAKLGSGAELTEEFIAEAVAAAAKDVTAAGDHRASARYRQKMLEVQLKIA